MSALTKLTEVIKHIIPESAKVHLRQQLHLPDMETSLLAMQRRGFRPISAIDVGAYAGEWTRMCKRIFPHAQIMMIEPQHAKENHLQRVQQDYHDVSIKQILVGASEQPRVGFFAQETASSVLRETVKSQDPTYYLPMTTMDSLTRSTPFAHPDLIKLDVQGYELHVLQGAETLLTGTEVVVMEANVIAIYDGAPLFHETVAFMAERDFRLYDICTFYHRPYDGALWQVDLIFVKSTSPLVVSRRWE
jgi:FkbM family methyltransferase